MTDRQLNKALRESINALEPLIESDLPISTRSAIDSLRRLLMDYAPEDTRPTRRRRSRRTDLKLVTD